MKSFTEFILAKVRGRRGPRPEFRSRGSRGITLIELLVVMFIIALIAGFAIPRYMNYLSRTRVDAAGIQIGRLGAILDLYRLDVGRYPADGEGLEALLTAPSDAARWNGPYLKNSKALTDSWGRPYLYRSPGQHGEYDLYSLGGDGAEGGEGEDADITSW